MQVFSVRLREALTKLTLQFPDRIPPGDEDRILCDRFFYGMRNDLKSSVRHLFDLPDVTFNLLLTAARRNELEDLDSKIKINSKAQISGNLLSLLELKLLKHLQQQLSDLHGCNEIRKFSKEIKSPCCTSLKERILGIQKHQMIKIRRGLI